MNRKKKRIATIFTLLLVCVACILVMPERLQAFQLGKVGFYITNETISNYNQLANKKFQLYESLSVFANYKKWSVGFTLRGNNFFKQSPNRTLDSLNSDVYRQYIEYNSKHLKVNVGDFYSLLGRGLVLSVLKNDDVLRERTITGGNVHYNKGRLDFKVLAGRVRDETANQKWYMAGGEMGLEFIKNHSVGVHFSYINDDYSYRELGKRLTYSVSLRGNKLFKNVSYYTEFAALDFEDTGKERGYGFYSNITYSKSHFTGFLEFKRYKDFDNEMNNPPLGDRTDEIATMADATGARVFLQYAFFEPDITVFFNVGRYEEYGETGNHIYGGFNIEDLNGRLSLSLSYGIRDILYPIKKWDGHLIYQFSDSWSAELTLKEKRYEDGLFVFKESDHGFQVSYSPIISVFVLHQYSHNKIIDLNHFFSGGITVYLKSGTAIKLSGGTIRGGQICSGGQCFVAPPFKGVKFSLLHTFK
ncbi:MAG: hypothetical protein GY950_30685 [bacterium]|nr:hypothetical protein [bacterium]